MVNINNIIFGDNSPFVLIAGPCVIENRDMIISTAERIKEITSKLNIPFVFKSSFKKANRTSLNSFTGIDFDGVLKIFEEVKHEFNFPLLTDVHTEKDIFSNYLGFNDILEDIQLYYSQVVSKDFNE